MNIKINTQLRDYDVRIFSRRWIRLISCLIVLNSGVLVQAEDDLPFSSGSDGSDGALSIPDHPTRRYNAAFGYDQVRGEFVLFGGYDQATGARLWDTWTSTTGSDWTPRSPDTFVSARSQSAMAWDGTTGNTASQTLVIFGGLRADDTVLDDFWSWDGDDWTEINVSPKPPARDGHCMVTDPATGFIYLLGGEAQDGSDYMDLWLWNGVEWTEIIDFGTAPDYYEDEYFGATYDPSDAAIVVYDEYRRKTWKYKDGTWAEISTALTPDVGYGFTLTYSPESGSCILFGGSSDRKETWEFKNDEWILLSTSNVPHDRYHGSAAYDTTNNAVVVTQGYIDSSYYLNAHHYNATTWQFKGGDWGQLSGQIYYFDMGGRPSGIWNFTTIKVPGNIEVRFTKNSGNTPVVWLAQGDVLIDGLLRLDGEDGKSNNGADNYAQGGPGGSAGGLGGIRFDVSGNYAGTPGQGAGGGAPGVTSGEYGSHGQFRGAYGNSLLLPMIAGSGGGGGASTTIYNGGHGGGGGGGILIASSTIITVNGTINADGGDRAYGGGSYGGDGSGGAIKLMADRVVGDGNLYARGGRGDTSEEGGRIRIEAFFRPLAENSSPLANTSAPISAPSFEDQPSLTIISVDGENVAIPPTGNLQTPDVVFTESGPVTIVVRGTDIPEGTPVTLRITSSGEIINLPAEGDPDVTMGADGTVSFTATVAPGLGTIQAYSEFTPTP